MAFYLSSKKRKDIDDTVNNDKKLKKSKKDKKKEKKSKKSKKTFLNLTGALKSLPKYRRSLFL